YRVLTDFRAGIPPYDLATIELQNEGGLAQPSADICFTPHGRSFIRYATAGAFNAMTIVPRITVRNSDTGLTRAVLVPPNGVARMSL
ncbi:MAG TPA: hypothetical protein VLS89_04185, partial [Candidatus Nanopelagicales bacterium]|nr:hypothetical protein [Candidatus Nanopelagicales bacterium]